MLDGTVKPAGAAGAANDDDDGDMKESASCNDKNNRNKGKKKRVYIFKNINKETKQVAMFCVLATKSYKKQTNGTLGNVWVFLFKYRKICILL